MTPAVLDPLEPRRLLAATLDDAGLLTVTGTEGPDVIVVRDDIRQIVVDVNGVTTTFDAASVGWAVVRGLGGNDRLEVVGVTARLEGGDGDDTLVGSDGNDELLGGSGNDSLDGGPGNDLLDGGAGDDYLMGGTGFDVSADEEAAGFFNRDTLLGGDGRDTLSGGSDSNVLDGGPGDDLLNGSGGRDTLTGGTGRDTLRGRGNGDTFFARDGEVDSVIGGGGNDVMTDRDDDDVVDFDAAQTRATARVGTGGGTASLARFAAVTFPADAFAGETEVTVERTNQPQFADLFDVTAAMFEPSSRMTSEFVVTVGDAAPEGDVEVTFVLDDAYLATLEADTEVQVFALVGHGGLGLYQTFEAIDPASVTPDAGGTAVRAVLPAGAFDTLWTDGVTYAAVVTVAATPGPTSDPLTGGMASRVAADPGQASCGCGPAATRDTFASQVAPQANNDFDPGDSGGCVGVNLGPPLENARVTSPFDPKPTQPGKRAHRGVDYEAAVGTPVLSMADGKIERIAFQKKTLDHTDQRTGKKETGWGNYVVVRHTDGSSTLYAHLKDVEASDAVTTPAVGTPVTKGQQIALSGNTGGSTGPHLHVEYAPSGAVYSKATRKADVSACVGDNLRGSITVADNGSLADDAFSLTLNGVPLCRTFIGASNTCGVGGLRPGTARLEITADIAPDDVGTFSISLADGLTFVGGMTTTSGTLAEGETATYLVVVPDARPPLP